MGSHIHGRCTSIRLCKLLIIKRKRSAVVYKRVVINKLLKYTEYALQIPGESVLVKPL